MGRKDFKLQKLTKTGKVAILIPAVGLLLTVVLSIYEKRDITVLERSESGKNEVRITAMGKYGETTLDIDILPQIESEEECQVLYEPFVTELKKTVLAENESFEEIESDLLFPETLEGYPFVVDYRVEPREYLSKNGAIIKQPEVSQPIDILMTVSCDYFENEERLSGCLLNTESNEEKFRREISEYLKEKNENDRSSKALCLEDYVAGEEVSWKIQKKSLIPKVPALCLLTECVLFTENKLKKREKIKKRKKEIREEYPEFAVKYSLLYNAGLPPIRALERIAADAKRRKKEGPLYEELNKALRENESGMSSVEALTKMAVSCDTDEIKYFCGLICQNMRKGGKDVAKDIKRAAGESEKIRRDEFRRKSETAGTKLTIPMIILLGMVFVLIMYPAFTQFSF